MRNKSGVPSFFMRVTGVWYRHYRVYTRFIISNGLPPFAEPLLFLAGIGLGLGSFINDMEGIPYIQYLSTGLFITTAMMTAAFECSYATFIRLEFEKIYDGMIAAPMTVYDLLIGENLWAGSKALFFSTAVLIVVFAFGFFRSPLGLFVPVIGFFTGLMFSTLSMLITSFVRSIDYFNFYFTGFLSPMFFLCGVIFPITSLPAPLQVLAEIVPLTHPVRLTRAVCFNRMDIISLFDILYMALFIVVVGFFALRKLKKRIVD